MTPPPTATCVLDLTGGCAAPQGSLFEPRFLSQGCILGKNSLAKGIFFFRNSLAKGLFLTTTPKNWHLGAKLASVFGKKIKNRIFVLKFLKIM